MEQRLKDVLRGAEGNYILPFYWQHGEDEALLREGMEKIRESGIRAVCVESRPHPDFLGDKWWADMDVIMDEARKRNMRVWVLDDAHFPTGYCNGKITEDSPYAKVFLDYYHVDVIGPTKGTSFIVKLGENEELVAVTAGLRDRDNAEKISDVVDLTPCVKVGVVYWDVPEGNWLITIIKTTRKAKVRQGYINTIDRDAVRFFIDTVYEPHFARYGEEFGKIFAGFFSDEPEIGNAAEHHRIGHSKSTLPWCEQLKNELKALWADDYAKKLTALFCDAEGISPKARVEFMDEVTRLYGENFCGQIGEWCRAHGVEYIGHIIEDNGCHARMGYGAGHFFRALWGQDMSGIDVVLQQIRPGFEDRNVHSVGGKGTYDGKLFQFALAKMGSSLGHIDEKKKGRTMCEMFGAYGWAEGLKLMKWLTDHMLVRGVNHFVPHAFTMKDFPDPDCPPHFYARGNNPQYPYFRCLMEYTNRVSHLINGGEHIPCVALFYNACAEWAGEYQPLEEVGMLLARAQIDYEVVPEDVLKECRFDSGKVIVGKEACNTVVFPYCEYLPEDIIKWCEAAVAQGVKLIFLKVLPKILGTEKTFECDGAVVVSGDELTCRLYELGVHEIKCEIDSPGLRYYHYRHNDGEYYLFFNESVNDMIETNVNIPLGSRACVWYDAYDNELSEAECCADKVYVKLDPYEARILCVASGQENRFATSDAVKKHCDKTGKCIELSGKWRLALNSFNGEFEEKELILDELVDITHPDNYPEFSGVMEYELTFDVPDMADGKCRLKLDCGEIYETTEVWINGKSLGTRITPPYILFGEANLKSCGNILKVRVINTLVHHERDYFSMSMPVEPSGLLGPVTITFCED